MERDYLDDEFLDVMEDEAEMEEKWDETAESLLEEGPCGYDPGPSPLERYLELCDAFGDEPDEGYIYELNEIASWRS